MPSDASIYSMIRQPAPVQGPLDQYTQMLQVRHLMGQQKVQDLQGQELERGIQDNAKIRDLFSRGNVKTDELMAIDPKTGMAYQKSLLENQGHEADLAKKKIDAFSAGAKQLRDMVAQAKSDADMPAIRDFAFKFIGPDAVKNIPERFDPQWQMRTIQTGDKMLEQIEAQKGRDVTTRGQDLTDKRTREQMAQSERHFQTTQNTPNLQHVELADGMYSFNPKTGKYEKAVGPDGQPLQGGKGLTESQGKATGLALRAQTAHDILTGLEDSGTKTPGIIKQGAEGVPLVGGALAMGVNKLPTYLGGPSSSQQKVEQAQRDFVNAALRVESGASISQSEFDNARKQYFPQPGDSKETIDQKRRARETEIESLKLQAGPGAKNLAARRSSPLDPKNPNPSVLAGSGKGVLTANADGSFNYGFGR